MEPPAGRRQRQIVAIWLTAALFLLLAAVIGRRLGHVDRVGGRKGVLEPLLERPFEPAPLGLFHLALGLVVEVPIHDSVRDIHESSPCRRPMTAALPEITRGTWPTFPRFPVPDAPSITASHAHHDLHRGPAAASPPQGAARLLRLRRGRLLFAGDLARQSAGS